VNLRAGSRVFAIALVLALASACAREPAPASPALKAYLARQEGALRAALAGDPEPWLALASRADDATLFPPFGGFERGWDAVSARYRFAAARLAGGGEPDVQVEILSSGASGDLAYVVALERSRVRMAGSDRYEDGFTRVTHILRRENGEWKLLHRHMDHEPEQFVPPVD